MINTLLSFATILALNTSDLNEDISLKKEAKLINEIIENLDAPQFPEVGLDDAKIISVYSPEGELLEQFSQENYDAKALRNVNFLIEDTHYKIFIKYRN